MGKNFKVVNLGNSWTFNLSQEAPSNTLRAVLLFPLAHENAYQWFVRLAPISRDQIWIVPHFPSKIPWPLFREHGFRRITGNTYKSLVADIPTTCTYDVWLTPSL